MKALYPGSFNPWHSGHQDIKNKALKIFEQVDILKCGPGGYCGLLNEYIWLSSYDAIIRGLRSAKDFNYEKDLQYWYEDLGIKLPIIYLICDRTKVHINSTVIRSIKEIRPVLNEYEKVF